MEGGGEARLRFPAFRRIAPSFLKHVYLNSIEINQTQPKNFQDHETF